MVEKLIIQAKDLSAVVVPGSLLLGVCWLTGTCWALGPNSFGFISVADVIRSALWFCPVQIVAMAFILTLREAFPALKRRADLESDNVADLLDERKKLQKSIAAVFCILVASLILLPPILFYSLITFLGVFITFAITRYTRASNREVRMTLFSKLLILTLGACFQVATLAYSITGMGVSAGFRPTESICIGKVCTEGTVIKRFSDATYVRWANDNHLTILLNSEVTSIINKRVLSDSPLFDTRSYFTNAWSWLTTEATIPIHAARQL